jgi:hypothetical protein
MHSLPFPPRFLVSAELETELEWFDSRKITRHFLLQRSDYRRLRNAAPLGDVVQGQAFRATPVAAVIRGRTWWYLAAVLSVGTLGFFTFILLRR